MAYITSSDMIAAFGEEEMIALSNLDNSSATVINGAVIQKAIDDACASVDGYLAVRYSVPIIPTPPVLTRITCDFARGILDQNNPREEVIRRWDMAVAYLKDLARGLAVLPMPQVEAPQATDSPQYRSPGRVFTRDTLSAY